MKKFLKRLGISFFVFFFLIYLYNRYNSKRFEVIKYKGNISFILSKILPIQERNITYLNEIYDDGKLVGFDCIKDSLLYFKIYKIGKSYKADVSNFVFYKKEELSKSFNIYQFAFFPPNIKSRLQERYNVEKLENLNINEINFNIKGNIIEEKKINNNLIIYDFIGSQFSFAINDDPNEIFDMMGLESRNQIFFTKDKSNNVFFGYVTSLPSVEKPDTIIWIK